MQRILWLSVVLLILASCNGSGTQTGSSTFADSSVVTWDRDPQTVVFRTEVVGGTDADSPLARNSIPLCTIYGDNRIVWTNDLGDYNVQVLWDQLSDQQIQDFISFLTISQLIFNYDAGRDLQIPGPIQPVVEVITINVNGREHQTDSYSSTPWPPDYFETIADFCTQVSRAPVLYEPTGGWLTVEQVDYDSNRPLQVWNSETTGLDFTEVAASGKPLWLTGPNLRILWNMLRTSSPTTLYIDPDGSAFNVILEVPGVHPSAAPAPES